jgi:hypothetical protein
MNFDTADMKPGWSWSKIESFMLCPFRFAMQNIARVNEPTGKMARLGNAIAVAMAEYRTRWFQDWADVKYSNHLETTVRQDEDLKKDYSEEALEDGTYDGEIQEAKAIWVKAISHMKLLPKREEVSKWWVEEKLAFDDNWERMTIPPPKKPPYDNWGDEAFRNKTHYRCKMDCAYLRKDGILVIEDDKGLAWKNKEPHQIMLNGFLMEKIEPRVRPETTVLMQYNLLSPRRVQELTPRTISDLAGADKWLRERIDEIKHTKEFEARQGKACDWCGFVDKCPRVTQVVDKAVELVKTKEPPYGVPDNLTREQFIPAAFSWAAAGLFRGAIQKSLVRFLRREDTPRAVEIPGMDGKEARLKWDVDRVAPAGQVIGGLIQAGIPKELILDKLGISWGRMEDVVHAAFPTGGKGVTKEVREERYLQRERLKNNMTPIFTEKVKAPVFGIFTKEEDKK